MPYFGKIRWLSTYAHPAPKEDDLARGILEAVDMDSFRVEKKAVMKIALADADAQIEPGPVEGGGQRGEPSA